MNVDAARVLRALDGQDVPRQARTIAKLAGLELDRANAALRLLDAAGLAHRDEYGLWTRVKVTS